MGFAVSVYVLLPALVAGSSVFLFSALFKRSYFKAAFSAVFLWFFVWYGVGLQMGAVHYYPNDAAQFSPLVAGIKASHRVAAALIVFGDLLIMFKFWRRLRAKKTP